jgi:D-alanyl-lipoteichoic acid acyltransferase DltB (MBOAT superfamily)
LRFAVFVSFFPQLVAGPIVRAVEFLPQLREDHRFHWDRAVSGALLVLWGYFLKIVIADSLAGPADLRFAEPELHSSASLAVGVVFYAFQIYADFAGYSCIAIGLARIFGFDFCRNFHRPYFAASFSEFWQRWHISLSTWLRDYLYIPLGGNRHGSWKTARNLMLTMLLGGLWHGANWRFVIWGGLHGSYLIVQRLLEKPWERFCTALRLPRFVVTPLLIGLVFLLTCVAWVFFRAESLADAVLILTRVASFHEFTFASVQGKFLVAKGFPLIGILLGVELVQSRWDASTFLVHRPAWAVLVTASILWMLALLGTYSQNNFIYFQF